MRVVNKYRLELHWNKIEYDEESALPKDSYFIGPVLVEAARIQPNDELLLDMTNQHLVFVPDYYQAVLKWGEINYKQDRVFLKDVTIKGKYVNSIETLKNTDWILIDCSQHEEAKHPFNLVYFSEVKKETGEEKFNNG